MASGSSGQAGRNENAEFIVMASPSQRSADDARELLRDSRVYSETPADD
jgi:hypothetical protein